MRGNPPEGGSYTVQPDGRLARREGTRPHAEGDAPRDAGGQVVRDGIPPPPEPSKPAKTSRKDA